MAGGSDRIFFEWQDGILVIRTHLREVRIRWQPAPRAEATGPGRHAHEAWPEFRMFRPYGAPADDGFFELGPEEAAAESARGALAEAKGLAFEGFQAAIPTDLAAAVARFPSHQWALLQLLHVRSEVRDLAAANPVLAFALANNGEFRDTPSDVAAAAAHRHCRHKQREIAGWLGFPATDAFVRILRKVPDEAVTFTRLRLLRKMLRSGPDRVRGLSLLPRLNGGVLDLIGFPRLQPLLTNSLLQEVGRHPAEDRGGQVVSLLQDVLRMDVQMEPTPLRDPVRTIASAHALHEAALAGYLAYVERMEELERRRRVETERRQLAERQAVRQRRAEEQAEQARREAGMMPPPPVPAGDGITPLASKAELGEESREQGNCVRSFFDEVCRGRVYMYRVTQPERASLSIRLGAGGRWYRGDLKGARNARVRRETELAVDLWLARAQYDLERGRRPAAPGANADPPVARPPDLFDGPAARG